MLGQQEDTWASINRRVLHRGGRFFGKQGLKLLKKSLMLLLKHSSPVWGPVVLILVLAITAYMLVYGHVKEATESTLGIQAKIAAFFGVEDEDLIKANERLFSEYQKLANTWDEELTAEQRAQVLAYKFPWSIMVATDRIVNDEFVWEEGKQGVAPKPKAVFEALRPRFTWKDSTVTTVTKTCSKKEPNPDGTGGGVTCSTSTDTRKVSLISTVDNFEGHYGYEYKWQTDVKKGTNGGSTTITREVVKQIKPPIVYYLPLKQYLSSTRGIEDEETFELIKELSLVYSPEYLFNRSMRGQSSVSKPTYALAYADTVQRILAQHPEVPQSLFLAVIAHESGGNWQASNSANTNGTTDAGLCQINSINWAGFGLTDDPYNVTRNVQAGATILGQALSRYQDFTQALYAYNGGTPSNGQKYNPTYAPKVMDLFTQLQSASGYAEFIPPISGQPMTIIVAEQSRETWEAYGQSGVNFTNPTKITVVNKRTGESTETKRTAGDGTMWAHEAWLYHPDLVDVQDGDILSVQFDNGQRINIEAKLTGKIGQMIEYAATFLGSPYVFGGNSPITGFDCSSYVQNVFAHFGVQLPRVTEDQIKMGHAVQQADLHPGDLVFFTTYEPGASHVGIYIGNRMMINDQNNGVSYDSLDNPYWASRYYGARRVDYSYE